MSINGLTAPIGAPMRLRAQAERERRRRQAKDEEVNLRPVKRFTPYGAALKLWNSTAQQIIISGPSNTGKAQPLDATVYTINGPKLMGDIAIGDLVCTPDGGVAPVLAIYPQGEQEIYRLYFSDEDWVECTDDHLWKVGYHSKTGSHKLKRRRVDRTAVLTTREIRERYLTPCGNRKFWIEPTSEVCFETQGIPIDPYVLGVLIGDGCLRRSVSFSSADQYIIREVGRRLGSEYEIVHRGNYDYDIRARGFRPHGPFRGQAGYIRFTHGKYRVRLREPGGAFAHEGSYASRIEAESVIADNRISGFSEEERTGVGLWNDLKDLGLANKYSHEKFVPTQYLYNHIAIRRSVLQGLMDTDGTVDRRTGQPSYGTTSYRLAANVQWLVESLGGNARVTRHIGKFGHSYNVYIRHANPEDLFTLKRKQKLARRTRSVRRYIREIRRSGKALAQCIAIDHPDHLYLTDHFVVTHNTRTVLEKLDALMWQYPEAQAAILRKTYQSTITTVLQTYERYVLGKDTAVRKLGGSRPSCYEYPNGSKVWVGGMDHRERVLSSERDIIVVNQTEELSLDDWEYLAQRASGRAGAMPYGQLTGDCNPSAPTHWIKQNGDAGKFLFLESRHQDNPTLYDPVTHELTERGKQEMAVLDGLTGVRKKRFRDGIWAAAEGMVYEDVWDPAIHLIDRREIPESWPRYWTVDYGFTNPFRWAAYAVDDDGRMIRYREVYYTQRTVEDHLATVLRVSLFDPRPRAIIVDHDAEDRATFEQHNTYCENCRQAIRAFDMSLHRGHALHRFDLTTTPAYKAISPGIQAQTTRLRKAGDDKPRLLYMRDSLVERDQRLVDSRKPCCAEEEYESYIWPKGSDGKAIKETPIAENNHGMDSDRYLICYVDKIGVESKQALGTGFMQGGARRKQAGW